ncbi:MAG: methylenetetrahydrofolate--tRNA-(uracil(54)-C(5))-methyltransferase (FADH(2)-oxidizing) TrmFO, partial [Myxococcota bacterium]|nr:methylenetetrahydrofolate--tRNA-(uracil(54)-C(5))-methyltransferase (FADH(2)-oxidizing) TrmFO [Myxococcota bacterium]
MREGEVVTVVGGGLAGCEVALQLGRRGVPVRLIEMKPVERTPAQVSDRLAELVCSNSFRSDELHSAIGLLKWEMRHAGSAIMAAADEAAVPAGAALAVDRERFSDAIEQEIERCPSIERITGRADEIPEGLSVICTGPLTAPKLAAAVAARAGQESLYFYDAIAPIIDAESIDWSIAWRQSRHDKGEGADYANLPMSEAQYYAFVEAVNAAEKVTPRAFEEAKYFEGCLPIEVMAERGPLTLAYGPLKPIGLKDPRSEDAPFAVVQLRMENLAATAWNMVGFQTRLKYPEQRRIFRTIPGLEGAEFLRYGSIHRNTYLNAPALLSEGLHWHDDPDLYFAGQITGVEGYVESTACGLLVAWQLLARLRGVELTPPPTTCAMGALRRHLRGDGILGDYAPSNLNWSFFDPIDKRRREKRREKRLRLSERARGALQEWWATWGERLS